MAANSIEKMLDALSELRTIRDTSVQDIDAQITQLQTQRATRTADQDAAIADLENRIRKSTIARGETVHGTDLLAVYVSGRVTWDTKALDGYAVAHPEVSQFRITGEPTVQIRRDTSDHKGR